MNRKEPEKAEDFIGWKSEDGKLEIVGIIGKTKMAPQHLKLPV